MQLAYPAGLLVPSVDVNVPLPVMLFILVTLAVPLEPGPPYSVNISTIAALTLAPSSSGIAVLSILIFAALATFSAPVVSMATSLPTVSPVTVRIDEASGTRRVLPYLADIS